MLDLGSRRSEWDKDKNYFFLVMSLIIFLQSQWIFFLIPLFFIFLFRPKPIFVFLSIALGLGLFYIQSFEFLKVKGTYFSYLNRFFDAHEYVSNYVDSLYDPKLAGFIKAFLFNYEKNTQSIYKSFENLGISYLLSISGFHFLLIYRIFSFICFKNKYLTNFLAFPFLFVYWVFINYSIPGLRALLSLIIGSKSIRQWSWSSLLALFFNVGIYATLSFKLSFILSFIFLLVRKYESHFFNKIMWNYWLSFIYASLLFLPITKKVYFWTFLNASIFIPVVSVFFAYYLFSWFITYLSSVHIFLMNLLDSFQNLIPFNKSYFLWNFWDVQLTNFSLVLLVCFLFQKQLKYLSG